jgi:DNA modification methylase
MNTDYAEFLNSKIKLSQYHGFNVEASEVNPMLYQHQRDIVRWAVKGGRRAVFAAFGLGKTFMQIEILRIIQKHKGGNALIVAPLGVRQEFMRDGQKLGVDIKFIRRTEEVTGEGFYITNYESVRDGKLDVNEFKTVTLDEASVLRSYGSKTYQTFLQIFDNVPFRFVCTATPSPNRFKELIHYAGYLGVMDTGQALTRFFQRDSTQANNLTLYPHKEKEFWFWVNSWGIFLQRPSDLGYSDEGYALPDMDIHYHMVRVNHSEAGLDRDGQVKMFRDAAISLQDTAKEKRDSLPSRIAKMMEIINADLESHYILWHDLEAERHAIMKALPECSEVYGSLDLDERERRIIAFSNGETKYLATKPEISGSGCNFQRHCHKAIFLGIGYKFNDFIQSIHRIHRFLQQHRVEIHIIYAESEDDVLKTLHEKWANHNKMTTNMTEIIREYGLSNDQMQEVLSRSIGVERIEVKGANFIAANNDCVEEVKLIESDSVGLIHTSIPFSNHYEYTPSYNDFGHNTDNGQFFAQMDYLTPELLRILQPGRVAAIHVKDRILFGNATGLGMPSVDPFHVDCINHYRKHGFVYFGMITVVTDVVRENNQTYRLGWSEQCKDGSKMGVGMPEYVLLFRKLPSDTSKAYADVKVSKDKKEYTRAQWQVDAHAFWRSSGDRFVLPEELESYPVDKIARMFQQFTLENIYDYEHHIRIGKDLDAKGKLPSTFMTLAPASHNAYVWHDVVRMRTLNGSQSQKGLNNHICPLQFDIVERIINRYSNEGDLVFDPFGGLMTVPYMALKLGRKGRASELNPEYFMDGVKYLQAEEYHQSVPKLFDLEAINQ